MERSTGGGKPIKSECTNFGREKKKTSRKNENENTKVSDNRRSNSTVDLTVLSGSARNTKKNKKEIVTQSLYVENITQYFVVFLTEQTAQ